MKRFVLWAIFALALLTGCAREAFTGEPETPAGEREWTVEMEATKAADPETKALYVGGGMLCFMWSYGDKVYVQKAGNEDPVGVLTVQAGGANEADLKGVLTGDFQVGDELTLSYLKPYGEISYARQKGTLEDVAANFDYALARVEVAAVEEVSGRLSLTPATFHSLQSINYFSFSYSSNWSNKITRLTITSNNISGGGGPGSRTVTVIPETPATDFYVSLQPCNNGEKAVYDFTAETENGKTYYGYKKADLLPGKAYKVSGFQLTEYNELSIPLTIQALASGTVTIQNPLALPIRWSKNDGAIWRNLDASDTITIQVEAGDRVILGGSSSTYGESSGLNSTRISCSSSFYLYGNMMSLVDWEHYYTGPYYYGTAAAYAFAHLFSGNANLYNHPARKIILPATKLGVGAYQCLFEDCTRLTESPDLPATTLLAGGSSDAGCYQEMFRGCSSLVTVPGILPATTLQTRCYYGMFSRCSSLKASPVLPAPELKWACYANMFRFSSSLQQITCLAKDRSAQFCTDQWVWGVGPSGVFIKDPDATWTTGINGIPEGWSYDVTPLTIEAIAAGTITITNPQGLAFTYGKSTSMATAVTSSDATINIPLAAGEKLCLWGDNASYAHASMVYLNTHITGSADHYVYGDIRSLVSSAGYPNVTTLADNAFTDLFRGNTCLKSHPALELTLGATSLGKSCYDGMFLGCTALKRAPALPATSLAERCYSQMFYGCTSLASAPALSATALAVGCYGGMFGLCTSLEKAPALPATTLAPLCYSGMFEGCTSLQAAPELPAPALKPQCYSYMFRDCSSLDEIVCLAAETSGGNNPESDNFMALADWVVGVRPRGDFVKKAGVSWPVGTSGIPEDWRRHDD